MVQEAEAFLKQIGYQEIPSNLPEFTIYFKVENSFVNVIHVIDYKRELYIGNDQYEHIQEKIYELFRQRGYNEIHLLSLILAQDLEKARKLAADDRFAWIITVGERRLIISRNQVSDFYGLKRELEDWLSKAPEHIEPDKGFPLQKKLPAVTIGLILLNVVIFIICTFTGELLYNIGDLEFFGVLERGEYYRFFTALFLHGGIPHLFNNMFLLYFIGEIVEKEIGKTGFLTAYLLSGLGGGILSLSYDIWSGQYYGSIGASGAIFGIMGVLLVLTALHKGRLQNVTLLRLLFMIIYSLSVGFSSTTTDNAAHIGGFITGVIVGIIAGLLKKVTGRKEEST